MPRTAITPASAVGPYPSLPLSANALDITFTAADVANKNSISFGSAAEMLILMHNGGASPYTVTITSVADELGRTGDIETYSLAAGEYAAFRVQRPGWVQSDGALYLEASNASVELAAIRL